MVKTPDYAYREIKSCKKGVVLLLFFLTSKHKNEYSCTYMFGEGHMELCGKGSARGEARHCDGVGVNIEHLQLLTQAYIEGDNLFQLEYFTRLR